MAHIIWQCNVYTCITAQFVLTEFLILNPISCNIHLNFYFTLCCLLHINHVPGICCTCILLSAKTFCHQILFVCNAWDSKFVHVCTVFILNLQVKFMKLHIIMYWDITYKQLHLCIKQVLEIMCTGTYMDLIYVLTSILLLFN